MAISQLFPVENIATLPADMNLWGDLISSNLLSKYPALSSFIGDVVFSKVENIDGNAVGYISLIGRQQKIPFIVDKRKLNPLDLYIDGDNYLPLNEDTVEKIVSRVWPFKLLSKHDEAQLTKVATHTDIAGLPTSLIMENIEEFKKIAEEHPELLLRYEEKDSTPAPTVTKQILDISIKTASSNEPIEVTNFKEGKTQSYSLSKFASEFGKEALSHVINGNELRMSNVDTFNTLPLDNVPLSKIAMISAGEPKPVMVKDKNGKLIPGRLYSVMSLHMFMSGASENKVHDTLFLSTGTPQPIGDIRSRWEAYPVEKTFGEVNASEAKNGDTAVILSDNLAYGPFNVIGSQVMEGTKVLTVEANMSRYYIKPIFGLKKVVMLDKQTIGLPLYKATIMPYLNFNYNTNFEKVASTTVRVSKLSNGKLLIADDGVSGIETNRLRGIGKTNAVTALMHCGLSEKESQYAVNEALGKGSYSFAASNQIENSKEKLASEENDSNPELAEKILKHVKEGNLLKFAAYNGDKSNVDLALELNLVTPTSVKKFRYLMPEISKMLDSLCKFLVCKRMAKSIVPVEEADITNAISSLYKVNVDLGTI